MVLTVIPVLVTGIQPSAGAELVTRWIPAMNAGMTRALGRPATRRIGDRED
jgi:hypothetical protein